MIFSLSLAAALYSEISDPMQMMSSYESLDSEDLDAGLALELSSLEDIFSTADALEGLSALIEGRRPNYTNS